MEYDIKKSSKLVMKEGIKIPNKEKIRTIGEKETYKYEGDEKKKRKKSNTGQPESYSRQNYTARALPKG